MRIVLKAIFVLFTITCTAYLLWEKYLLFNKEISLSLLNAEGAFYYSYFLRLTQSSSIGNYFSTIVSDSRIQVTNPLNSLLTLPILFEIIVGIMYRNVSNFYYVDPLHFYVLSTFIFISISAYFLGYIFYSKHNNSAVFFYMLFFMLINDRFLKIGMRENLALFPLLISVICISELVNGSRYKNNTVLHCILAVFVSLGAWQFSQFVIMGMLGILTLLSFMRILNINTGAISLLGIIFLSLRMWAISFNVDAIRNFMISMFGTDSFDSVLYKKCSGLYFQPPKDFTLLGMYVVLAIITVLILAYAHIKIKKGERLFLVGVIVLFGLFVSIASRFYILYIPLIGIILLKFGNRRVGFICSILALGVLLITQPILNHSVPTLSKHNVVQWLITSEHTNAVVAGPMEITSQLLIDSRFSIVNPVFYETKYSHKANKDVYGVYGFTDSKKYHATLSNYKTTHLILDRSMCESNTCNVSPFYPVESNKKLCDVLVTQTTPYFQLQYYNDQYAVFRVAR